MTLLDHAGHTFGIAGLQHLIDELDERGYEVFGPQVRNGVITHDRLTASADLPHGWTDRQEGGSYRLVPRDDGARFGFAVGHGSWKSLLHPAKAKVWTMARRPDGALEVTMEEHDPPPRAFIGVKPCELAAIRKQDHVLLDGPHPDPAYGAGRQQNFLVVVDCGSPASTCFCPSMGTGPSAGPGHDIALTELVDGDSVSYVARSGTELGAEILAAVTDAPATEAEQVAAEAVVAEAERIITRSLDTEGLRERLLDRLDSPHWNEVADRCLTCANCTLVCPTCFCTDLLDVTDLTGDNSERWRVWDSCFSLEYSHLGPGPHRSSAASRYRQWLTHKLATWIDQFGESGCVGCGRCITWCPVGIDLTAEVAALDASPTTEEATT